MSKKIIIGVSGKKQSGKNTLCDCVYKLFLEKYSSDDIVILSFADSLKQKICKDVLGLTEQQVNGTDEQKNSLTMYKWKYIPRAISDGKRGFMTAREIMQVVGTDIFRNYFDDNVWVNATLREINNSNVKVILISDIRFPSEVISIINEEGYVIRLLRDVCETDSHSSENALNDFDFKRQNCIILDNKDMNVKQQNEATISLLSKILISNENFVR